MECNPERSVKGNNDVSLVYLSNWRRGYKYLCDEAS